MNAKSHVFSPLARLLYPPDAFEKRSIDSRCRSVAVHASEKTKTAKSGGTSPSEAVTASRDESPPADRRVTGEYTSRRKGGRRREWRSLDPRATGANTSRRKKTKTAEVTQRDKRLFGKRATEWRRSTRSRLESQWNGQTAYHTELHR